MHKLVTVVNVYGGKSSVAGVVMQSSKRRKPIDWAHEKEISVLEEVTAEDIADKEESMESENKILNVYGNLKTETDKDMNSTNPYMSSYFQVRQNNLAEKKAMFKTLQLDALKAEMKVLAELEEESKEKENKPRGKAVPAKSSPYQIRKRSERQKDNKTTKGGVVLPLRRLSTRLIKQESKSLNEDSLINDTIISQKGPERREGPLYVSDVIQEMEDDKNWQEHFKELANYLSSRNIENEEEEARKSWISTIKCYKTARRNWVYTPKSAYNLDVFKSKVSKLRMMCGCVTKVVRERIASVAVHPSKDRLIVAAGGKKGALGIWVVHPSLSSDNGKIKKESGSESASGVYMFQPHDGQINCASFCEFRGDRLITSSYDGIIRCLDLEKLVFKQLYASPEDLPKKWMQWHCQLSANVILASQGTGNVYVLDDRSHRDHEAVLKCYERSCRTVNIHPLHPMYLATSSSCGYSSIWDLRKFGGKTSENNEKFSMLKGVLNSKAAICHLGEEKRTFSSAFFSPITGSGLLTTSSDDYIRIYDTSKLVEGIPNSSLYRVETGIKHNNKTGMWLTTFKATWHPQRDDAFVVGSMAQPRQIEVYARHGRLLSTIGKDGPLPINTVCSVNVFHPHRMVLASADSGGRVHIFL